MSVKTKPRKKGLSFAQLMSRVSKAQDFPGLLKNAAQTGKLSDGSFMISLSDKELDQVKEVYRNNPSAKRSTPVPFPQQERVGFLVDDVKESKSAARLTANGRTVTIDLELFLAVKRRHPNATIFVPRDGENHVVFSDRADDGRTWQTVALLPVQ